MRVHGEWMKLQDTTSLRLDIKHVARYMRCSQVNASKLFDNVVKRMV